MNQFQTCIFKFSVFFIIIWLDHERPLSKAGRADAADVSYKLQRLGWVPELILCRFVIYWMWPSDDVLLYFEYYIYSKVLNPLTDTHACSILAVMLQGQGRHSRLCKRDARASYRLQYISFQVSTRLLLWMVKLLNISNKWSANFPQMTFLQLCELIYCIFSLALLVLGIHYSVWPDT